MKFGINTTSVVLEMVNFTRLRLVKFIPISNTTLMIFIPNFTATHAIASTNYICNTYLIQNSQAVKKVSDPQKGYGEKRCEIQGGGQEMAVKVG